MSIENFYICRFCKACYEDGEVDCFECEGEACVYLFQEKTYEVAIEKAIEKFGKTLRCDECDEVFKEDYCVFHDAESSVPMCFPCAEPLLKILK
jgi:hypothetical protein